jgi:EPS-associated MarR family transcriptional regulator
MNNLSAPIPDIALNVRTLDLLDESPELNQRQLAAQLGISLGKANYCLRALLAKGLVKAQNFKNSQNKLAYAYVLTPSGIAARADLTLEFLQIKRQEYEKLRQEIDLLQAKAQYFYPSASQPPVNAEQLAQYSPNQQATS